MKKREEDPQRRPLTRSEMMSRVKSKNTKPELKVRSLLHRSGLRFRINDHDLPGTPDIVLPSRRCVIFVHGCFWHRHPGCVSTRASKTRVEFWEKKFHDNVERDDRVRLELEEAGWSVIVVWECETKDVEVMERFTAMVKALPTIR